MNLITIIPIARGIGKEHLTYFSIESPALGSVVEIPLRSRMIMGLVSAVEIASARKSEIKNLPYGIKRMERVTAHEFLLPGFMEAVRYCAEYYASTTGAVLSTLLPKAILDSIEDIVEQGSSSESHEENAGENDKENHITQTPISDISAIQGAREERLSAYKSLIREEFARKKSVMIVLSGREEIRQLEDILQKGIEHHTYVLHTGLSKKEIVQRWINILAADQPTLIITTGYFLSLPRKDISTIIIEDESSRGFIVPSRPYLDLRFVAETIGRKSGIRIILGAPILRVETMRRIKEDEIAEFGRLKIRANTEAECILADMRSGKQDEKKEFVVIGETLREAIAASQERKESIFLLCSRKGLSPITVCGDCGHTVSCTHCGAPTVLHKKGDHTVFLCRRCGETYPSDTMCAQCGSWKLVPLGIGIETAEKELRRLFPTTDILVMDKDHVTTHAQAEAVLRKFTPDSGRILLGTELAIPYLNHIDLCGIVSIDSLFAIPEFRITERIMHILISLRAITSRTMIVQSRRPDEHVFEYALRGNLSDFYREEILERERFGYPPFNTFIKISLDVPRSPTQTARTKMEKAQEALKPYDLNVFASAHALHGLLIIPREKWPDTILLEKLRALPQELSIRVDPESLL